MLAVWGLGPTDVYRDDMDVDGAIKTFMHDFLDVWVLLTLHFPPFKFTLVVDSDENDTNLITIKSYR